MMTKDQETDQMAKTPKTPTTDADFAQFVLFLEMDGVLPVLEDAMARGIESGWWFVEDGIFVPGATSHEQAIRILREAGQEEAADVLADVTDAGESISLRSMWLDEQAE